MKLCRAPYSPKKLALLCAAAVLAVATVLAVGLVMAARGINDIPEITTDQGLVRVETAFQTEEGQLYLALFRQYRNPQNRSFLDNELYVLEKEANQSELMVSVRVGDKIYRASSQGLQKHFSGGGNTYYTYYTVAVSEPLPPVTKIQVAVAGANYKTFPVKQAADLVARSYTVKAPNGQIQVQMAPLQDDARNLLVTCTSDDITYPQLENVQLVGDDRSYQQALAVPLQQSPSHTVTLYRQSRSLPDGAKSATISAVTELDFYGIGYTQPADENSFSYQLDQLPQNPEQPLVIESRLSDIQAALYRDNNFVYLLLQDSQTADSWQAQTVQVRYRFDNDWTDQALTFSPWTGSGTRYFGHQTAAQFLVEDGADTITLSFTNMHYYQMSLHWLPIHTEN